MCDKHAETPRKPKRCKDLRKNMYMGQKQSQRKWIGNIEILAREISLRNTYLVRVGSPEESSSKYYIDTIKEQTNI